MNAVSLGPLVFSHERLHVVIAIAAFLGAVELAAWFRATRSPDVHRWSLIVVACWIVAARAGFVLANLDSFAAEPLSALAIWQGGFAASGGAVGLALAALAMMLRRPGVLRPLAFAVLAGGLAYTAAGQVFPVEARGQLPQIALPTLDGAPVPLADTGGRPVVVNLWATWCPPCRREMPMMMDLASNRDDVVVRFANQGEPRATVLRYLDSQDLGGERVLLDPDQRLMETFGLLGLPSTLFFDADGRLVAVHTGEISRAALANRMNDLSPEAP
ncbi:prolipoprotein diacylglyceryl transferase family protein [Ponticoccus sp. (in: a-proteobacteria)]|uniref:prolipoprotein diacylglyceryl transferase family protein n=1 Tax=Ponticoccus sp. (in: a-proteobacteria) TaxID=1925025 RepID=UPI003AB5910F